MGCHAPAQLFTKIMEDQLQCCCPSSLAPAAATKRLCSGIVLVLVPGKPARWRVEAGATCPWCSAATLGSDPPEAQLLPVPLAAICAPAEPSHCPSAANLVQGEVVLDVDKIRS